MVELFYKEQNETDKCYGEKGVHDSSDKKLYRLFAGLFARLTHERSQKTIEPMLRVLVLPLHITRELEKSDEDERQDDKCQ